jgi:glutamate synthase domain-containing protein 1
MKNLKHINNNFNDDKVIDACSIFGAMNTSGKRFSGASVIKAIANMHDRGNGLGGGFAVYGLYPEYKDLHAFHIMFLSPDGKKETEAYLNERFDIIHQEDVPNRKTAKVIDPPVIKRYFLDISRHQPDITMQDDYILQSIMHINMTRKDSFVFSGGKDMAVFKGVGYPEEIADFFELEQYEGYIWTSHGRFPTNTQAWWGGAHPFSILDWTVVHNGEISSYGINRRYLEEYGYHCTMQTDTEVITYAVDLLMRKHKLPVEIMAKVLAPPFWDDIERMPKKEQELALALRQVYGSLMLNGPFAILVAHHGELIGLTDRIRLRPLTVGEKDDMVYFSSEESAIRLISPTLDRAWTPMGGEPVIAKLNTGCNTKIEKGKEAVVAGS